MTAYWAQFSHAEIMSMHGVEIDEDRDVDFDDMIEKDPEEHCCSGCMDCLGLSWRDFM